MYPKITTSKKEYTTREPKTETHFNQSNPLSLILILSKNKAPTLCLSHGFPRSVMEEIFRCYGGLGCQRLVVRKGVWLKEIVIKLERKKIKIGTKLVKKRKLFKKKLMWSFLDI